LSQEEEENNQDQPQTVEDKKAAEYVKFHLSMKRTDTDLNALFKGIPQGNRSDYARQLMRDGLRFRQMNGIPLKLGGEVDLISMQEGNAFNQQASAAEINIEPTKEIQTLDITTTQINVKQSKDVVVDDKAAMDALFAKQHM
jgi:hypothetical protein